jgi:hypothetical protein
MTAPLANCLEFLAAMSVFLPIPCRNNTYSNTILWLSLSTTHLNFLVNDISYCTIANWSKITILNFM